MTYTKKLISIMLIAILMLSIIPFGATEQVENPAPLEQAAQIEETAPEEAPPSPTEASTPAEDPPLPTEAPVPIVTEAPTEIPAPVVTEAPTEQPAPTEQTSTEEPPSPTEQATQQPLPSSTVQAAIVEKIGWEHAPLYVNVGPDEIGLGNSFVVSLAVDSGGTGKFTYAYYIYKGNTVVQKTGYSTNTSYTYTPKTTGKFHAVVFIKNEKGETRTLTSFYKVNVVEKHNPIGVAASALTNNIVLGDTKSFDIYSWDGAASHMHAYYVYCNNKLIERFPYKQAKYFIELGSHYSQVSYTPKSPGKYKFVFFAKDTLGKTQTYTTNEYLVSGAALDLRANVAFKKYHIGSVANITAQASGGSGTYQYAYYVYRNNVILQKFSYTANAQFNYTLKSPGTYKVMAFVKDSLGTIKMNETSEFFVENYPLNVTLKGNYYSGEISCTIYPEGGVAPYTYAYYIYKNNAIIKKYPYIKGKGDDINDHYNNLKYTAKNSGKYKILVFVKDATGTIKTATTQEYLVNKDLEVSPSIQDSIKLGNTINVHPNARQGEGFYQYAYYIYKNNNLEEKLPYTNNGNLAYKPKSIGIYKVQVFVKDGTGKIAFAMSNECDVEANPALELRNVNISEVALTNSQIDVGAFARNGVEPYQFAYYIYRDNKIVKKTGYTQCENIPDAPYGVQNYSFTATVPGNYHVIVFAKDATGAIVMKTTDKCLVSNNPQPDGYQEIGLGVSYWNDTTTLKFNVNVYKGLPPYQYAYYVFKNGERIITSNYENVYYDEFSFDYNVIETARYTVTVFVKDSIGKIKIQNIINNYFVDISQLNKPQINTIQFEKNTINLGERFEVTTEYQNGVSIAYDVYKDGALYYKSNFRSRTLISHFYFKPNHTGRYTVKAIVRSANGTTVSKFTSDYCNVK